MSSATTSSAPANVDSDLTRHVVDIVAATSSLGAENVDSAEGEDGEGSTPTPTSASLNSSALSFSSSTSSSPSISPSSSITTDTSVTSDTNQGDRASDKDTHEEYNVTERRNRLSSDTIVPSWEIQANAGADLKQQQHVNTITATATIPTTSTSASAPSTPASSSSTSLPGPTPTSSSAPTSTSSSTANVNETGIDSNGLMSLLRPRPQINQSLNVKFAPLPELAPRKRKSSTPLGMAARSQLARRRRMMYQDSYDDDGVYEESYRPRRYHPPEIAEEAGMEAGIDGAQGNGNVKKKIKKKKDGEEGEKKAGREGEQEEEEDPLAALAKKMGRAGKHLWRKMSSGSKAKGGDDANKLDVEPIVILGTAISDEPERLREGGEHGEGGVWIEEVGEQCGKLQEARVKESIEVDPSLSYAASIPLPPSAPQSPAEAISRVPLPPVPTVNLEPGTTCGDDSQKERKLDATPSTPSMVVSAV